MEVMKTCRMIRRVSAVLLLVALFLPLSRCSEQGTMNKEGAGSGDVLGAAAPESYRYYYAWTDFQALSIASWLVFIAFLWPLPFLAYEIASRPRAARLWSSVVQIPFAAGSIALIYFHTFLNELWVGGYLAYISLGAYSLALTAEIIIGIYRKVKSNPQGISKPAGP